jgi:hypothetical protein
MTVIATGALAAGVVGAASADEPAARGNAREVGPPVTAASPSGAGEDRDNADEQAREDLRAFLEYLGSWDESDQEWQQFHPSDGLAEVRVPPPAQHRGAAKPPPGDDDGRT